MSTLKVVLLTETSRAPERRYPDDGGYDLCSNEEVVLRPRARRRIRTGVALGIPAGYVGLMFPRSGQSWTHGVDMLAPVVDSGYTGEVHAVVINHGDTDLEIAVGDRIAQITLVACARFPVEVVASLPASDRGGRGFGSSGA